MPNRPDKQTVGGTGPVKAGDQPTFEAPPETEALSFDAHDAQLNKALTRFDRERAGSRGAEFPHDETYAPGYHAGGARFGFFNGKDDAGSPAHPAATDAASPEADDKT